MYFPEHRRRLIWRLWIVSHPVRVLAVAALALSVVTGSIALGVTRPASPHRASVASARVQSWISERDRLAGEQLTRDARTRILEAAQVRIRHAAVVAHRRVTRHHQIEHRHHMAELARQHAAQVAQARAAAAAHAAAVAAARRRAEAVLAARRRAVAAAAAQPAPAPTGVQSVAAFKAWAEAQVGSSEFGCLDALWNRESGWNRYARNVSSGAYGIPQSLPAAKMATAGADWSWNGYTQMRWGLAYIRDVYGTPCGAWSHSQATGWY